MSGNKERNLLSTIYCPICKEFPRKHYTVGVGVNPIVWLYMVNEVFTKEVHENRPTSQLESEFDYVYCTDCTTFFSKRPIKTTSWVMNNNFVERVLSYMKTVPYLVCIDEYGNREFENVW